MTLKQIEKRIEKLELALKVIITWAKCHEDGLETLVPAHVIKIASEALDG